jgi:hypothetical protein
MPRARTAPSHYAWDLLTLTEGERTLEEEDRVLAGPESAATLLGINRWALQFRVGKLGIVRPDVMWVGAWSIGSDVQLLPVG